MHHISDLRQYRYCPRLYWLKQHQESSANFAFVQMISSMQQALIEKLQVKDAVHGFRGMQSTDSLELFNQHEWAFNLRFEAEGLRVKVSALHHTQEEITLYFTSMASLPKIEDSNYYGLVLSVLEKNNIKPSQVIVMYFDKDYRRQKDLDVQACFKLSSRFLKPSGFDQGDILSISSKRIQAYHEDILQMDRIKTMDEYPYQLEDCAYQNKCESFGQCFPQQVQAMSSEHVLSHKLRQVLENPEVDDALHPLSRSDYAQIQAHQLNGRFVDHLSLTHWLKQFEGQRISFVDFEWDTYGIPPYEGMRPFDVLPFQFSMHSLDDGKLIHQEFLGQGDCREDFIQSFLKCLPKEGLILAYNAFGAEVIRLQHLGDQFPHYKEALDQVIARFVDLAQVFVGGTVYDVKMKGSFSLKNLVLAIDPELSYEKLAISHGIDAVLHYRTLQDDESDEPKRQALLSYCHMDTLAMVKVFEWLKTI